MYIFSNKSKLYALSVCCTSVLFVTVFSHTAFHCLLYLIFPLFGKTTRYLSKYMYICFVYAF